ncbi:hypothetical protein [Terriglobus roseus]|nr:hypothetical protein [Terriglobus roseus]
MRRLLSGLALCATLGASVALIGCHSHYIQATITNASDAPLNVVQVDYPSASFGTQLLAPGASFHYRFKLLGSGNIKVSFTDAARQDHAQTGPWLNEGQEGTLEITLPSQDHAEFHTSLKP